ncbi:MAG: PilT domain protein [Phycisphaerales bacterium]|nr:PilT domain protein [Phycisphaerales bacterium]
MSDRRRRVMLDSNVVTYAASDPGGPHATFVRAADPVVAAILPIEVLGYHRITAAERTALEALLAGFAVLPPNDAMVVRAITLRQARKMSLGDSIIAVTALEYRLPLATRNVADCRWISALEVIDPATPDP